MDYILTWNTSHHRTTLFFTISIRSTYSIWGTRAKALIACGAVLYVSRLHPLWWGKAGVGVFNTTGLPGVMICKVLWIHLRTNHHLITIYSYYFTGEWSPLLSFYHQFGQISGKTVYTDTTTGLLSLCASCNPVTEIQYSAPSILRPPMGPIICNLILQVVLK